MAGRSRWLVGSSSTSRFTPRAWRSASAARVRSPGESVVTGRSTCAARRPNFASSVRTSPSGQSGTSRANASSSGARAPASSCARAWSTSPIATLDPSDALPAASGARPSSACSSVVLPDPFTPVIAIRSPASTCRSTGPSVKAAPPSGPASGLPPRCTTAPRRVATTLEPRKEWELQYEIAAAPRRSSVGATLRGAVVHLGGKPDAGPDGGAAFTLGPVDLQVDAGDRIAITGVNGSGKTTLLHALLGRAPLAAGSASLGSSVAIGEVDQARAQLDAGARAPLLEAFAREVPDWPDGEVRTLLAKFGLRAAHVLRPVTTLSPGERTRAALALLQARGVNLLVLDEPTNHLDLPAIEQLEAALEGYTGTLLLVTHDRRMLDAVTVNRRWVVDAGSVREV